MGLLPISKGVFRTQYQDSLRNSEFCEELINLMIDQAGGNFDRPTLDLFATLDSTEIIGSYYFAGVLVFVTSDRKIYTVDLNGTVTDITTTTLPGVERAVFADNGSSLFIVGGGTPIVWNGIGSMTADLGGSPPNFSHIVYIDGYLIGNRTDNNAIQYADYQDETSWTGTNLFSAVADPDAVKGLTVSQREIYVVGAKTTEVWQNIGTSPVPFGRAFVWQYGTPAPYSITQDDNSVFFLDHNKRILRISGRETARISEGIESAISSYETVTDCWSRSFTYKGSIHVLFVFPTAGRAWSIDLKNSQWTEWRGYDNGLARLRLNSLVYVNELGLTFGGDYQTGKIWQFSDTEKTDADDVFVRQRRMSVFDGGADVRKVDHRLRFSLKRNVASAYSGTTSETNPTLELRWRDDGKQWSSWRPSSLGEKGTAEKFIDFRRLGTYRQRQYEFRMTDPAECNIVKIDQLTEAKAS